MGGEIPNIVSRWANAESQELNTPIRYLFRRAVPDSGGPGKYRGGVCHEYAFTPNGTKGPMGLVLFGKGTRAPMSLGIFGGYPGCNVGYSTFRGANVDELPGASTSYAASASEDQFWGQLELDEGTSSTSASWAAAGTATRSTATPCSSRRTSRGGLVTEERRTARSTALSSRTARSTSGDGGAETRSARERLAARPGGPDMRPRSSRRACGSPSTCSEPRAAATQCTLVR